MKRRLVAASVAAAIGIIGLDIGPAAADQPGPGDKQCTPGQQGNPHPGHKGGVCDNPNHGDDRTPSQPQGNCQRRPPPCPGGRHRGGRGRRRLPFARLERRMLVPWLGFVDPLVLPSPTAIPLAGPPSLDSDEYAAEFAEVRDYGSSVSLRSADQTATALFWTANSVRQYQIAMRDQVSGRGLDIVDSARVFAMLDSSLADAAVACWRAKYDFNFWRPITGLALADTDGNDATDVVPGWTPLTPNPPYPEYTSGHACITGAATSTLNHVFGTTLDPAFDVPSLATTPDRQFTSTTDLDNQTMNARVWLGIHFRTAMTDGNALGHAVADFAAANYFQPTD